MHAISKIQVLQYNDTVYNLSTGNNEGFFASGILVGDMYLQNREEIK
ncbi:MAG: hypothetical protein LBP35_02410 [Candidatus Ancillula trichonymphae]|nr:hypothetical protein [Candidatus Ancillula trichonymphae]